MKQGIKEESESDARAPEVRERTRAERRALKSLKISSTVRGLEEADDICGCVFVRIVCPYLLMCV